MHESYPGVYRDKYGVEQIVIHNDGKALTTTIRGVQFKGTTFDALESVQSLDVERLGLFRFRKGYLDFYSLECIMAIPVVTPKEQVEGLLAIRLRTGEVPSRVILSLELKLGEDSYVSKRRGDYKSGYFEDELLNLQAELPANTYLKACINCAFSDYSPYGTDTYASLACFRDNKEGYRNIRSKYDLFEIWDTMTEFVQETYLCPEFERRKPGTGYRG